MKLWRMLPLLALLVSAGLSYALPQDAQCIFSGTVRIDGAIPSVVSDTPHVQLMLGSTVVRTATYNPDSGRYAVSAFHSDGFNDSDVVVFRIVYNGDTIIARTHGDPSIFIGTTLPTPPSDASLRTVNLSNNHPPTAVPEVVRVFEDTPALVALTGTDPDADSLGFALSTPPSHGTVIVIPKIPGTLFLTTMSGTQEVPPNAAPGTGAGIFLLNAAHDSLWYALVMAGLTDTSMGVQLRNAAIGVNGSNVRTLSNDKRDTIYGVWTSSDAQPLTPTLVTELLAGRIYVNVNTSTHSGGELRGQVLPPPDSLFHNRQFVIYIPGPHFVGADNFAFTVNDGMAQSAPATVNVIVTSTTGVSRTGGTVPAFYGLEQNFPNPFNPTTVISYQIPVTSFVSLKVFNVLGKEVATLVERTQGAGYKSVQFDGAELPSGMYFYRLEATGLSKPASTFTTVRKLLLIK